MFYKGVNKVDESEMLTFGFPRLLVFGGNFQGHSLDKYLVTPFTFQSCIKNRTV